VTVSLGAIANRTLLITARYAGQWLIVGNTVYTAPADEAEIRVYGTGNVIVGPGWWDRHGVYDGVYDGDYFDGSYTSTVGTDTLSVERSTDGGETWETIADGLSSDAGVGDPYPPLFGPLHYRAVAVSLLPSVAYGDAVEVTPPEPTRVWLTTESGAALSLPYDLAVPSSHTPGVELHRVLGRTRPVAAFSLDYEPALSVDVSGVTLPQQGEPGEEVWAATVLGQHVYYRDPAGRRFWGVIDGALSWKPTWWGHDSVSFSVTAVDHD